MKRPFFSPSPRCKTSQSCAFFFCAQLILLPLLAAAETIYWDGGNGSWDSTANWTTDPTETTPDPTAVPGISDDVYFNRDDVNAAQTISLDAPQSALSITFRQTANTILQGGGTDQTLTLGAGGMDIIAGAGAVTIGSSTAGQNVGIILNDSQSWTNDSSNIVTITNAISGASTGNQILTINGTGAFSLLGGISDGASGTVSLIKDGTGTLSLRSPSTYTGETTVKGGTINNGGSTTTISGALGTGHLTIEGGSFVNNAGSGNSGFLFTNTSQTWAGDFSLATQGSNTTTLTLGVATTDSITLTGDRRVSVSGQASTSRININGAIGDGGAGYNLTWTGDGNVRVTLGNAASSYSGTTTIEAGWIQFSANVGIGTNSAFGNSTTAILLGGTSNNAPAGILATANATFARDITLQSGGTGTLVIGGTVFSGGETGGNMTNTGKITLGTGTTGRSVTLHRGNFSGDIVDPEGLLSSPGVVTISAFRTINGNAENSTSVTLSGNNTFSGGVNLTNDGNGAVNSTVTLNINSATALGTGTLIIGSSLADRNVAINSTAGSPVTLTTNNAQVWNGDFRWSGAQALDMGTGAVSLGTNAGATRTITTNGANALSIGGIISDGTHGTTPTVNLTKSGTGTLILYGNSTYTGQTTIESGTLQIGKGGNTGNLATSEVINGNTLVFNRSDSAFTFSAAISGTGKVVQAGSGRTTLAGVSSYTGDTIINAGTLAVDGSIANSSVIINSGGTLAGTGRTGALSGAGAVGPGNSPGILTAESLDPSDGMDFHFQLAVAVPAWSSAINSGNDVLRLDGATPISTAMTSENTFNIYLGSIGTFVGGIYTDLDSDFTALVDNATFNFFLLDGGGAVSYEGQNYTALDPASVSWSVVQVASADFEDGTVNNGLAMQFSAVPEPAVALQFAFAALGCAAVRRRRK
jgi:fibronectin-binding autotransporter adhesin